MDPCHLDSDDADQIPPSAQPQREEPSFARRGRGPLPKHHRLNHRDRRGGLGADVTSRKSSAAAAPRLANPSSRSEAGGEARVGRRADGQSTSDGGESLNAVTGGDAKIRDVKVTEMKVTSTSTTQSTIPRITATAPSTALASNSSSLTTTSNPVNAAAPKRTIFDPWNSSSTGHQRAENRLSGSTSWRESRSLKLSEQFRSGRDGGKRVSDTVGAGSASFGKDGRNVNGGWVRGARGLRGGGQRGLGEFFGKIEKGTGSLGGSSPEANITVGGEDEEEESMITTQVPAETHNDADITPPPPPPAQQQETQPTQIFTGLTFHLNGTTAPQISDHKLRHLIASHGGNMAISLARRAVTHVILGTPSRQGGCGGGLAGSKLQKEIERTRGRGVKFVGVEWVLECLKHGKRVPEGRFLEGGGGVGRARGQGSVGGWLGKKSGGG